MAYEMRSRDWSSNVCSSDLELVKILEGRETRFAQRMRRVLVIEDDARQLESLRLLLASRDVETVEARTGAECLEQLASGTFDCMVLDLNLPEIGRASCRERVCQYV